MTDYVDLFSFLDNERSDVRLMASRGLAQISKDNAALFKFFSDPANSKSAAQKLADLIDTKVQLQKIPVLPHILLSVVNISADTACCEVLVQKNVATKLLKLFETLAGRGPEDGMELSLIFTLQELALMALNNMTATCTSACEQVLELDDEDLAGYQLGRLKTHYDRAPDFLVVAASEKEDEKEKEKGKKEDEEEEGENDEKEGKKKNEKQQEAEAASNKNDNKSHRRWLLQIALNCTRIQAGAKLFLEDDDWVTLPKELVHHPFLYIRSLAMQLVRNLSNYKDLHELLVDTAEVVKPVIEAVCAKETDLTLLHGWVDVIAQFLASEAGIRGIEELNGKKDLQAAVDQCEDKFGPLNEEVGGEGGNNKASSTMQVLSADSDDEDEDEIAKKKKKKEDEERKSTAKNCKRKTVLEREVGRRIDEEILPYLDDIQDVFVKQDE